METNDDGCMDDGSPAPTMGDYLSLPLRTRRYGPACPRCERMLRYGEACKCKAPTPADTEE